MTVKPYVSHDREGHPLPPENSQEAWACIDIVKRLWLAFSGSPDLYVVIANFRNPLPNADLVIISELGIGVVELKHSHGKITRRDDVWYAGKYPIGVREDGTPRSNPFEQVRAYARELRGRLVSPPAQQAIRQWLPGQSADWQKVHLQTAVCFTHPDVNIRPIQADLQQRPLHDRELGEFSVLTPLDMPSWAAGLRFGVQQGREQDFEPYRLTADHMQKIAVLLMKAVAWDEIVGLMPTGHPYGYLSLIENGKRVQVYGLDREEMIIGRNPNLCTLPLPQPYTQVSREHASVFRSGKDIFIADRDSANGTYVNGRPVQKRTRLKEGDSITLGGPAATEKICHLQFSYQLQTSALLATQHFGPSHPTEPDPGPEQP